MMFASGSSALHKISRHILLPHDLEPEEAARDQRRAAADMISGPATMLTAGDAFDHLCQFATAWQTAETIDALNRAIEAAHAHEMLPDVVVMRRDHGGHLPGRGRTVIWQPASAQRPGARPLAPA
jgi:hypothetical protein